MSGCETKPLKPVLPEPTTPPVARVVRIDSPPQHYTLLRTADGSYLGTDDGRALAAYEDASDTVMWERQEDSPRCRHAVTGLSVDLEPATTAPGYHILQAGHVVGSDGHLLSAERGPQYLPSEYLRTFKQNGWVCLAALLSAGTVAQLQEIAGAGPWPRTVADHEAAPLNRSAAVAKVAAEPVSLWLVRQYLRTHDVCLAHSPSLSVLDQDDGRCDVQGWHSDFPYLWGSPPAVGGDRLPSGTSAGLVLGVQRNVCITAFSHANGATCFKLGSHRGDTGPPREWGVDADYARPGYREQHGLPYDGPEADVIEAPAGSVILYDARTWHRAGVNRTPNRRAALLQAMTPTYVMPFKDTSEPYKLLRNSELSAQLTGRERREIARLMVRKIVGPLGEHAITVDTELSSAAYDT